MAYQTGTVTGHYALLAAIRDFVENTLPVDERYTVLRAVDTGNNHEVIWELPGDGIQKIYCGLKTYQSIAADYYNFQIACFTGFVDSNSFETQPGIHTPRGIPLINTALQYWITADEYGFAFSAKIETVYVHGIVQRYYSYSTPFQYPYPVICGGCLTTASATRYSETNYHAWFTGGGYLVLRHPTGWTTPAVHPYSGSTNWNLRNTTENPTTEADGYYGLSPLLLSDNSNAYGEVRNLYFISGYNNVVENTFTIAGDDYLVLRNIYRTGFRDYIAMKLA
jgi:hypothetical protein